MIDGNKDNQEDFENRSLEDQSEKFNQSLVKRYLRQLIKHYDYAAALAILQEKIIRSFLNRKEPRHAIF